MLRKLNCYVKRVSIFLITAALIAGMAGCDNYTPPSKDLEIRTWYDLDDVRNNLAGNHTLMNDLDSTTAGYEELASPIANGGFGWQPIGTEAEEFVGNFDGQGYEIRDLFINSPGEMYVGLFGVVDEVGQIEDIGVIDTDVVGEEGVGGLVGICYGTVTNSHSTGRVSGESGVGGLVGASYGIVSNSYSSGDVTGFVIGVGGLVGQNRGIVSNSYAMGTVICSAILVGGLVAVNEGTVTNSYSTGNVTGDMEVGGLVGMNGWYMNGYSNPGTVSNSYSTGSVTGKDDVGGLVGGNGYESIVSDSYATGNVDGDRSVGGLVGTNAGSVSDSYSTGNVTGEADVGGLVGPHKCSVVSNSFYNYDEVMINGEKIITVGALFGEDFDQWLANDKFLNVNERLSQESGYYVISDVDDFKELLAFGQDNSLKFRLTSDLDLGGDPDFYIPYLAGEFDGNGHKISSLSLNFNFVSDVGLFGHLAPGGKVNQVGVESVNITGGENVGGLVGYSWNGTVSNSYATGSVTGDKYVGGLVGYHDCGTVSNSCSTGSVSSGGSFVGGLMGKTWKGTVSNSYATGNVTSGGSFVGGLVGDNSATVSNSYSTGSVTGLSHVGGLVGGNYGTVSNSFWDIQTSGQATSDGGTGKNTTEMQDIATFSGAAWDIVAVADPGERNHSHIWNIVDDETYPFLSWQP